MVQNPAAGNAGYSGRGTGHLIIVQKKELPKGGSFFSGLAGQLFAIRCPLSASRRPVFNGYCVTIGRYRDSSPAAQNDGSGGKGNPVTQAPSSGRSSPIGVRIGLCAAKAPPKGGFFLMSHIRPLRGLGPSTKGLLSSAAYGDTSGRALRCSLCVQAMLIY